MAEREDTSRSFNPKHRIVGAVVLVAAAVIIVPLILKNRAPQVPTAPVAETPVPDSKVEVTPVAPAQPEPVNPAQAVPPPMPMTPGAQAPAASGQPAAQVPESTAPASAEQNPPATPELAPKKARSVAPAHIRHQAVHVAKASVTHGWVIQLGAFSNRTNALRVKQKLERKGFRAELDRVKLDGKIGVRVRVGPVKKNSEARMLQAHIARQTGIKGVVLAYP